MYIHIERERERDRDGWKRAGRGLGKGGPRKGGHTKMYNLVKTMFGPGVNRRCLASTCA